MLATKSVSRHFNASSERVIAVNSMDIDVSSGEFVCLMGPSGCGKSTLLALMGGLDTPDEGEVFFDGQLLSTLSAERRASIRLRKIGMVFQDHQLVPELTALENVMLPLELQGQHHGAAQEAAGRALVSVGLQAQSNRFPSQLSGGQNQRVGIARSIAGDRQVLLADEATGSLDHKNSRMIFQLFQDLAARGYAVLAATHDLSGSEYATRTVQMIDGSLALPSGTTR